jgi:heme/copper-type cytochrome/quinol oxidase subunit 2
MYQLSFSEPATGNAFAIHVLHNDVMVLMTLVCVYVLWIIVRLGTSFSPNTKYQVPTKHRYSFGSFHSKYMLLEFLWSGLPMLIILVIGYPSFTLLYSLEETLNPQLNFKIIGNQWYWTYEYKLANSSTKHGQKPILESYMKNEMSDGLPYLRLLDTDQHIQFPSNTLIRLLITSTDVLHSWAMPAFGVKVDACPGRLNITTIYVKKLGQYYGQCSEICGVNHGFMPICVEMVSQHDWLVENYTAYSGF